MMMRGIKQHHKEEEKQLHTVEKALTKEKKNTKVKRERLEGAPKRPATAFFRWAGSTRESIKAEMGADSKPTEVMRRAGELWKTVDDKTRAKYQAEYEAEKAKYDVTMAKLKAAAPKKEKAAAPAAAPAAAAAAASPDRGVKRAHSSSVASDADSVTDLDTSVAPDSACKKHKKKSKKSKSHKKSKKSKKSHGSETD